MHVAALGGMTPARVTVVAAAGACCVAGISLFHDSRSIAELAPLRQQLEANRTTLNHSRGDNH